MRSRDTEPALNLLGLCGPLRLGVFASNSFSRHRENLRKKQNFESFAVRMHTDKAILALIDAQQRHIGDVVVERTDGGLSVGRFIPGPAFPQVQEVFREFEEAVESQALSVTDAIERRIAALGLCARRSGAQECAKVHDIQIWMDGGISLRWGEAEQPSEQAPHAAR